MKAGIIESQMSNKNILINAVTINETKKVRKHIVTTHNKLFRVMSQSNYNIPTAKEVVNYRAALWNG